MNRVTVGARLGVRLSQVGQRIDLDGVINRTASRAMVMTGEVAGMTGGTLAAARDCRCLERTVGRGVMTGGAGIG